MFSLPNFELQKNDQKSNLRSKINTTLDISFKVDPSGKTYINKQYSSYPHHICKALYLDEAKTEGMASIYTQSSSGGIYKNDCLGVNLTVNPGAKVHFTTQASTIIHKSLEGQARQHTNILALDHSYIEYFPDPIILFPDANLVSSVLLEVANNANVILFDSFLTHDLNNKGQIFDQLSTELIIQDRHQKPKVIDRISLSGSNFSRKTLGVMGGYKYFGSIIVYYPKCCVEKWITELRDTINKHNDLFGNASILPNSNGISVKILANNAISLKKGLIAVWKQHRFLTFQQYPNKRKK